MRHSTASLLGLSSAVLLAVTAGCAVTPPAEEDASESALTSSGSWGAPILLRDRTTTDRSSTRPAGGWHVTPIHATAMPNGKVFVTGWSRASRESCTFPEGSRRNGASFVLDPALLPTDAASPPREVAISPLDEKLAGAGAWKKVLYCAGHVPIVVRGEAAVLLTGGSRYLNLGDPDRELEEGLRSMHLAYGARSTPSIDALADGLKSGPLCKRNEGQELLPGEAQARGGKWYPTNTRLPDGRVLVTGGFTGGPRSQCAEGRHSASAEIFDPASLTTTVLFQPEDLGAGVGERFAPGDKDYTHTLLLPEPVRRGGHDYQVAMMGYAGFIVLLSLDPGLAASERLYVPPNGARPGDAMAWDSTMALVSTGEILVMGGTDDAGTATRIHLYDPKADAWTSVDTKTGRRNAAATLLPDGNVLLVNGWRDDSRELGLDKRTEPIIFDPETRRFRSYPGFTGDRERGYHSFSLLAKDGSIVVGGGIYPSSAVGGAPKETDIGCERTDVQRWRPPYMDPELPRPVVRASDDAPLTVAVGGQPLEVPFSGKLHPTKGAALMALGSFTHGFDQNQRYVRLTYSVKGDRVVLDAPKSASVAPPGDYLLFLVGENGAPSTGKHVRVSLGR